MFETLNISCEIVTEMFEYLFGQISLSIPIVLIFIAISDELSIN